MDKIDESQVVEFGEEAIAQEERNLLKSSRQKTAMVELPESVDNMTDSRTAKYFPPIVKQLGGACAAYSTTYYIMTYMLAMERGYDVKNDCSKILSPRFIYNLKNGGKDEGMVGTEAFRVALNYGCPFISDFPLSGTNQYTELPTTERVWRNALSNKMKESGVGSIGEFKDKTVITNNKDSNLECIKTYLANGYVLKISTYFNSWRWKKQEGTQEAVCVAVSGREGAHGMTVVGYDDSIWVDINGNGTKDAGELGAFKIVNTHGATWNGKGWAWFAYDAINEVSAVPGAPVYQERGKGWWSNAFYWITAYKAYEPILTARFKVQTNARKDITIKLAYSELPAASGTSVEIPCNVFADSGSFSIDGTKGNSEAVVVLDYTKALKKAELSTAGLSRWYLLLGQGEATFSDISVKDEVTGKSYSLTYLKSADNYDFWKEDIRLPRIFSGKKQWKISFNWPLNVDTVTPDSIYVQDSQERRADVELIAGTDRKSVTIKAPEEGYMPGIPYTVTVSKKLRTEGGNALPDIYTYQFVTKEQ